MNIITKIPAIFLCIAGLNTAYAVPAKPGFRTYLQPDGSAIRLELIGDEHMSFYQTSDGIPVICDNGVYEYAVAESGTVVSSGIMAHDQSDRGEKDMTFLKACNINDFRQNVRKSRRIIQCSNSSVSKFPSQGEVKGLIILAEFSDVEFASTTANADFTCAMNAPGYSDNGATGSARDYFMDQSNGAFVPQFDVVGPVKLPNQQAYYGRNTNEGKDPNAKYMIFDACREAKTQFDIDFSNYDYDNNGEVDLVFVIYAGYNEAQGGGENTVWPHAWDIKLGNLDLRIDGKKIGRYACTSELMGYDGVVPDGIGTFCHEFSHCLGLMDVYDVEYSGMTGMGAWDLMDAGAYNNSSRTPAGYTAYEKEAVGWMSIPTLDVPTPGVTLRNLAKYNEAYKIVSPHNPNEFFTLENRQNVGWDKALPGHGLIISHIDYDEGIWNNNLLNTKRGGYPHLQIVPASGQLSMLETAAYPGVSGNDCFSHFSSPESSLYYGDMLMAPVTDIKESDGIITFNFRTFIEAPFARTADNISETSCQAKWDPVDNIEFYSVDIRSINEGKRHAIIEDDVVSLEAGEFFISEMLDLSGHHTFTLSAGIKGARTTINGVKIVLKGADGKEIDSKKITVRNSDRTEYWVFNSNKDGCIEIQADTDLQLSNVTVYNGNVENKLRNNEDICESEYNLSKHISQVYDTDVLVDGLHPGREYLFTVTGVNDSLGSKSSPSNKIAFKTEGTPDDGESGITEIIESDSLLVYSTHQGIAIARDGLDIRIFDISGRLIQQLTSEAGSTVALPSGVYVVSAGATTMKCFVR